MTHTNTHKKSKNKPTSQIIHTYQNKINTHKEYTTFALTIAISPTKTITQLIPKLKPKNKKNIRGKAKKNKKTTTTPTIQKTPIPLKTK
jgi:predicted transcriptional regulator